MGSLITGIEARVVKSGGAAVAPGEVGELHVRGPNVMRGYYRAPEATAAVIDAEGWFKTAISRDSKTTFFTSWAVRRS